MHFRKLFSNIIKSNQILTKNLQKYRLSKKPTKDANIWHTVSLSFLDLFDGDPRNMFKKCFPDFCNFWMIVFIKRSLSFFNKIDIYLPAINVPKWRIYELSNNNLSIIAFLAGRIALAKYKRDFLANLIIGF